MSSKTEVIMQLVDVWKAYRVGDIVTWALKGVNLSILRGEFIAIMGPSGSGKTTLLNIIGLLDRPTKGKVYIDGVDVSALPSDELARLRNRKIGFVFQQFNLVARMSVYENIELPLMPAGVPPRLRREMILKALKAAGGESEWLAKKPTQLSGGQQQRVAIARAIILRPLLVVLDEPTSSLDVSVQAQILNLLLDLQDRHKLTYIFITHDLLTAKHVSDFIMVMYLGKVVEYSTVHEVFGNPKHPYTVSLLSSIPLPDPKLRDRRRVEVVGEPPSPLNPPKGCRYHPRCPYATEVCRSKEPELLELSKRHFVACHRVSELSFNEFLADISSFLSE